MNPRPPEEDAVLVSVVIPTHNRCSVLAVTLRSVLEQRDVRFEVVVVDDGSSDDTPAWLASLGDPRVRVLRNEVPAGVARARNLGIAAAQGTWVAFLDDDDLWAPAKLRSQLEAAQGSDVGLVYVGALQTDDDRYVTSVLRCPPPADLRSRILEHNVLPAGQSSVMVRADVLDRVGGFDEGLMHFADWDMWIRLVGDTSCAACPEPLVAYVVHEGGMLVSGDGDKWGELERIRSKHAVTARELGVTIGGDEFLGWMIWVNRRAGRRLTASRLFIRRGFASRRPADFLRAFGLLFGERAIGLARLRAPRPSQPAWVERLWATMRR
jgi:glycosyltransferase involved in cell wall biosynthesis